MRTPLNKALAPSTNKENGPSTVGAYPGKANTMDKEIKKVADLAAELAANTDPEAKATQYLKSIEEAQAAQKAAAKEKEEAITEAAFNKACDDESHARDKESFFRRQLERLKYTPRMEEATYYRHVDTIKAAVEKAAEDFRKVAEKAIDELAAAKAAYDEITKEADAALTVLDNAANVLQTKYRYREITFNNAPSKKVDDPNEWTKHMVRYNINGKAFSLIVNDGVNLNKKARAAWNAVESVAGKE